MTTQVWGTSLENAATTSVLGMGSELSSVTHAFRAMGTDCELTVYGAGAEEFAAMGVQRVELLERCWSRFRASSELTHLNSLAGTGPVRVSDDLLTLVDIMLEAWKSTGGLFDPTVINSMNALGYDRDFASVIARDAIAAVTAQITRAPGMGDVQIDEEAMTVSLPAGVGVDPGAIGKGLAADIIVEELMNAGADGVLVNLGGDIVFAGSPGSDAPWVIAILDERLPLDSDDRVVRHLEFEAGTDHGAVATSTTLKRVWADGRHHVIDPRTGDVARTDLVQATIAASSGWWAEVAATTALLLGSEKASEWLDQNELVHVLMTPLDLLGNE
jgi:thiamine biosynthesis lipoprotein